MRFFTFPNFFLFFASVFYRKNCENHGFWPAKTLPKLSQNPSKIDVPKNMRFFIDFCSKNALLQKCPHRFRIGFYSTFCLLGTFLQIAFCMHFRSKNPTKNPSKTRSEPFQNRCQKCVVFQHPFFRVLASILEGLGPPSWSQVRRAACSAWRVKSHCIFAFFNILLYIA